MANTKQQERPIRILLVEDNPGDVRLIQEMLKMAKTHTFSVEHVDSAGSCVEMLERENIDVILLDLSLPDTNGHETYDTVRRANEHIPIIIMTGLSDETVALEMVQRGAQDSLNKGDVDENQLERAVGYAVERGAILRELHQSRASVRATKEELEHAIKNIREDLDIAGKIQRAFMPKKDVILPGIDVIGLYVPSAEVGGDLYDYMQIDNTRVALLVVDVAGHGVASALVAAMAKISFTRHLRRYTEPNEVFTRVNSDLIDYLPANLYCTAFLGILDTAMQEFIFSSAGHPPALLIDREFGTIQQLTTRGPFIGMFPKSKHITDRARLNVGDKLVLYTDGIFEGAREDRQPFGKKRLLDVLTRTSHAPIGETVASLEKEYRDFVGNAPQQDDITILGAQLNP